MNYALLLVSYGMNGEQCWLHGWKLFSLSGRMGKIMMITKIANDDISRCHVQPIVLLFTWPEYYLYFHLSRSLTVGVFYAISTLLNQIVLFHYPGGELDTVKLCLVVISEKLWNWFFFLFAILNCVAGEDAGRIGELKSVETSARDWIAMFFWLQFYAPQDCASLSLAWWAPSAVELCWIKLIDLSKKTYRMKKKVCKLIFH